MIWLRFVLDVWVLGGSRDALPDSICRSCL